MSALTANKRPAKLPAFPHGNSWSFALLCGFAAMAAGMALDLASGGRGIPAPQFPDNLVILIVLILLQIALAVVLRKRPVFAGLAGGRLAVVTLGLLCLWAIPLGSLPQVIAGESAPIWQRVMQAPPFVFLILLLLANLGWGMIAQLSKGLSGKSLFLFNHFGIYLTVAAALFGMGDLVRLDVWVREGNLVWYGSDGNGSRELPFAIHLQRFHVEYYPPQLTLIDSTSREILMPPGTDLLDLKAGTRQRWMDFTIVVEELTDDAPWSAPGDPIPAAKITVSDLNGETASGWISSGSPIMPPIFLALGPVGFAMPIPRARLYESTFNLVPPEGDPLAYTVQVNRPVKHAGWWLYQKGYNIDAGPKARSSQLEAVRDPWLPLVYCGFTLMAIGSLLALGRAGALLRQVPGSSTADPATRRCQP